MKIPTTYEEKLAKIESLYPSNDWIYKLLDKMQEPTSAKIAAAYERVANDPNATPEEQFFPDPGFTTEEAELHERINDIKLRRDHQLMQRQEAIRNTFTLEECEQMVIS